MRERIQIKHDLEENWKKAVNFTPLAGELIIYDGVMENGEYIVTPRIKIGDGITKVNDLPFLNTSQNKTYAEDNTLIIPGN